MGESRYASGKRVDKKEILTIYDELQNVDHIQTFLDSLPYPCFILNSCRQVVFASESLLVNNAEDIITSVLGNRVGEILGCIHASEDDGCGTSEACRFCGAVNTILFCLKNKKKFTDECRIHAVVDNQNIYYDYRVTASPFFYNNNQYIIFSLVDISDEKRRKAMEQIFFHDVNNKVGSLNGLIDLLKNPKSLKKKNEYMQMLEIIGNSISQEINAHKQLLSAENGELQVNITKFSSKQFINETYIIIKQNSTAYSKNVEINLHMGDIIITSDEIILQRIILNMLKNALESVNFEEIVTIGCDIIENSIQIWVQNPGVIPDDIQKQIFLRSFSTKGNDRGLGTYSMKLLGENYLKGKVDFKSNEKEGTIFYISLPIQ